MGATSAAESPVGVIGVGRMGLAVCARLAECGFVVTATDIRSEARISVEGLGAGWAGSAAEVARGCRRVLTILPGVVEVDAVRSELVAALRPGSVWIDLSTSTPAAARANAEQATRRGVRTLDAPMGGGPTDARGGGLTLFVGGAADDLDAQRDVTDALAERVLHVGGVGSGCLVKLLVNLLWFGQAVAGAEVLALAARAGLDPERVRDAVSNSAGASRFMSREAHTLLAGDDLTAFSLSGCIEEVHAVLRLGREHEMPLALAERVAEMYEAAFERYGDIDGELLAARLVIERAGVTFTRDRP